MSRFRNLTTALAAAMLCAAPSLHAVELQSAGSDTKLSVYGFVWGYANYFIDSVNSGEPTGAGSMFYGDWANQTSRPDKQLQFSMAPTRFGFASTTPSANLGDIQTKIEYDINTNNSHIRHAYIKFAGWTFGRAWSLWNDLDAGADTVDWAGPVGVACFDTPRYLQVSYVGSIDKNNTFGISLEQNSGQGDGSNLITGAKYNKSDYKVPSIVGMYSYAGDWGHVGVRVLGQNYGAYKPADATAKDRYSKMFMAFQLSGDVKIAKDALVWQFYTGKALGNYGTGFQAAYFDEANKDVIGMQNIGWMVGYTHNWTDKVRSNIALSGVTFKSDDKLDAAGLTGGTDGDALKTGYSAHVNTFVMLSKNLQFGAEYVYEKAKAFGSDADLVAWKDIDNKNVKEQSNSKIHLALKATF